MRLDISIMTEICKDLTRQWSINELATTIKKHYSPVYKAATRLIKQRILIKNKSGLIEPLFYNTDFLEIAEKNRLSQMKDKDILVIQKKIIDIESSFFTAVLFGSSVYRKGNDIDLLIIIPDDAPIEKFKIKSKIALGSFLQNVDLNIINEVSCYEMLNKPNELNVMNEIMKNHIVLVGYENFYRMIKRWKNA
jgi:predicted nucleotidyltransferase